MKERIDTVTSFLLVASASCSIALAANTINLPEGKAAPSAQSSSIPDWDTGAAKNEPQSVIGTTNKLAHVKPLVGRIQELSDDSIPSAPDAPISGASGLPSGIPLHFVDTFPRSFLGRWNGKVTIVRNDYGVLKTRDKAMYTRESHIMYPGRTGIGQVYFELSGDETRAVLPLAEFAPTPADAKYMDLVKQKVGAKTKFDVRFRARCRTTITGTLASSSLTFDHITALKDNIFEEQIATESDVIDKVKDTLTRGSQETVLQFHLLDPKQMEVTMATVHYARDGAMESKLIIHGIFTRH
jgi:hypothetical protein